MALNYNKSTVGGVVLYSGVGEPPYQLGKKGDLFVRTDRPNMYIHYGVDAGWGNFNVNGYTGSAGALGYVGSIGYTGSRGVSTYIRGTVPDFASLPPSPERGDSYIIGVDLWVFDNTDNWINVGRIVGDIGYTGSIGFTGSIGIGYTGSQGMAGFMGFTGSQGINGINGYTGSIGYTGSQGAGFTGSRGDNGINGYTGSIGYTGSQGAGFTGSRGDTGFTGSGGLGYTGSAGAGFTGSAGDLGYTGSIGYTGSRGDIGYTGSIGNLPSLTGNALKILEVNAGETAAQWSQPGFIVVTSLTDVGYTVALSGAGTYIRITSSSGQTVTVPEDVAVPLGGIFTFRQGGTGQITIVGTGSVVINTPETLKSRATGSTITLIKVGTNIWDLSGDLEIV